MNDLMNKETMGSLQIAEIADKQRNVEIKIFENAQFGRIRTSVTESGEPLFCLADLCKAIDISNSRNVRNRLDKEDVYLVDTPTNGGEQTLTYVSESGMYEVILRSDSQQAKPFRKWVTSEVLPSIRKTGKYEIGVPQSFAEALQLAADQAKKIEEQQKSIEIKEAQIQENAPKVQFADAITSSKECCLVGELAKLIAQNDKSMGQNRLYKWMRDNEYLGKWGNFKNVPMQAYIESGLFELRKTTWTDSNGDKHNGTTTVVTPKGQKYFINKLLSENEQNKGVTKTQK